MENLSSHLDSVPPCHVGGLVEQVVAHPAGDGEHGHGLGHELLLPADTDKHIAHLVTDLDVALLLVAGSVRVHLVDADDELLHTEKVEDTGVLAGLSLDLTGLGITLLDRGGEVTIGGNHEESNVGLGGTCASHVDISYRQRHERRRDRMKGLSSIETECASSCRGEIAHTLIYIYLHRVTQGSASGRSPPLTLTHDHARTTLTCTIIIYSWFCMTSLLWWCVRHKHTSKDLMQLFTAPWRCAATKQTGQKGIHHVCETWRKYFSFKSPTTTERTVGARG